MLGTVQCVTLRMISAFDSTSGRSLLLRLSIVVLEITRSYAEVIRVCGELMTGSFLLLLLIPPIKSSSNILKTNDK